MAEHVMYRCPHGHAFPATVPVLCPDVECAAFVVCEPSARGMELDRQLQALREAVRAFLNGAPLDEHGRFTDAARESLYRAATSDYVCPHCGAHDSTRCAFTIDERYGYPRVDAGAARRVGCRVMHFHDRETSS